MTGLVQKIKMGTELINGENCMFDCMKRVNICLLIHCLKEPHLFNQLVVGKV